jgi:PAS domain S-box-containing protein
MTPGHTEEVGILLHRDGIIVDANEETALIFGCTRDQIIGRLLADLLIIDDLSTEVVGFRHAATCEPIPIEVLRRPSPSGFDF